MDMTPVYFLNLFKKTKDGSVDLSSKYTLYFYHSFHEAETYLLNSASKTVKVDGEDILCDDVFECMYSYALIEKVYPNRRVPRNETTQWWYLGIFNEGQCVEVAKIERPSYIADYGSCATFENLYRESRKIEPTPLSPEEIEEYKKICEESGED